MKNRILLVKVTNNEAFKVLSKKIYKDPSSELLPSTREVKLINGSVSTKITKSVKRYKKPKYEFQKHWNDMTPFVSNNKKNFVKVYFHLDESYTNEILSELFEQKINDKTKSVFFPPKELTGWNYLRWLGDRGNPQYPIYIISKGRSENCVTADALIKMDVPFNIVVEKQEIEEYAKYYGYDRLIELDMRFKDEYDTYIENFDESLSKGSGPARNFVWYHSKYIKKSKYHWIIDDNIFQFDYYDGIKRIKAVDGTLFAAAEDFVNRYDNIGISGLNYRNFVIPDSKYIPYVANTKIYSCILINNEIPIRWAGRYNEDVDICIRALKEGYSTIQFDAFNADKAPTQQFDGGNTNAFYAEEGTLPKSNQLAWNHPDITSVVWKFGRWHHNTNYDIFDYYKDRTIEETINDMCKNQILDPNDPIIPEIKQIDIKRINEWDNVLENADPNKRKEILKVLKFYRFTKDINRIIEYLTAPKLLNSDLIGYKWGDELEDTLDNRIMLDLLKLGDDDGMLFYSIDWDSYLNYVPEDKRIKIKNEMQRNKYLQKTYKKYNYNLKEIKLTIDEHLQWRDSKAYILNKYFNQTPKLPEPKTRYDKKIRGEIKVKRQNFKSQLVFRDTKYTKSDNYVHMIVGDELFNDKKLLTTELNKYNFQEVISTVNFNIDLMIANYMLKHKIPNKNFVPDVLKNGIGAYRILYAEMLKYSDECLIFCKFVLSKDLEYLTQELEKNKKPYRIIIESLNNGIEDW